MRKSMWIIALLFVANCAPAVYADSFTNFTMTNFTLTDGSILPTSGSITYDNTTNLFTAFTIVFDSTALDLTAEANSPTSINAGPATAQNFLSLLMGNNPSFTNLYEVVLVPSRSSQFTVNSRPLDSNCCAMEATHFEAYQGEAAADSTGTFAITENVQGVSEPSSCALLLLGVGFLFVLMRKRIPRGLPTGQLSASLTTRN
jgi:hypothetical protein